MGDGFSVVSIGSCPSVVQSDRLVCSEFGLDFLVLDHCVTLSVVLTFFGGLEIPTLSLRLHFFASSLLLLF